VLQAASGRRSHISVFGQDYDTPDGTCIRDYVHINDLCEAHWLALQSLAAGGESQAYNLGNGSGFSVQAVIDTARRVTGRDIAVQYAPRRAGDLARLVADASLALVGVSRPVPRHAALETFDRSRLAGRAPLSGRPEHSAICSAAFEPRGELQGARPSRPSR
jgi:UDP-glucose 4-epimerase